MDSRPREASGLLFALAGFALLSVGDAVVKSMAGQWPGVMVGALRYTFGMIGLGAAVAVFEGREGFQLPRPKWQVVRGVGVAMATIAFFSALFVMPLASATAITFTSPMITGLLAALLLGEPIRRATWIASLTAFVGVLIVLRPNVLALGITGLLPLGSATGMALMMIGNRAVAGRASALAMQFSLALIAVTILVPVALLAQASGIAALHAGVPHWSVIAKCLYVALNATTAHALIYLATTRTGAATIAPMTYVQFLMASLFGWLFFREHPDATALLGAAIIVGAGLYLWRSGRVIDAPEGTE